MAQDLLFNGGIFLAVIVVVEAVALSGLTKLGIRSDEPWLSPENIFLLLSDYVLGILLIYLLVTGDSQLATCFTLGSIGITHLFRCVQRVMDMPRPFCANTVMVLLNMGKLVMGSVLWGICVALGY